MKHTIKHKALRGTTPVRNLRIVTDRGPIRLAIFTEARSCHTKKGCDDAPPLEVDITLRNLLAQQEDPITREPPKADWHSYPPEEGFYVRWERGEGLSEIYYGGEDTPEEFVKSSDTAQFFGPFFIPL